MHGGLTGRRVLALAVALTLAVIGQIGAARAHAVLLDAAPAADTVVDTAPAMVVLAFNEPVQPIFARVLDATGNPVSRDEAVRSVDQRVEIDLPDTLAKGGYIVTWRVVSQDSHPVGGSYRFAVGHMPEAWRGSAHVDDAEKGERLWRIGAVLGRTVFLLALLSAAGGVWFLALFSPYANPAIVRDTRRRTVAFASAAAISAIGLIPVQGGLMLAPGLDGLLDSAVWCTGAETPLGMSAFVAAGAAVAIGACLALGSGKTMLFLLSGIALIGAGSLALTGHAAAAPPRALATAAIALHGVAAAFWLGALWPLLAATRRLPATEAARLLARFSKLAVIAVALLIAAGLVIALVQVERPSALIATDYGRMLLLKLGLVALVLLLAVQNKRRLTPALAQGSEQARGRLLRTIRIEIGAIAAIILITAALGQTTPPRSLPIHSVDTHYHRASNHAGSIVVDATDPFGRRARIEIAPGRPGRNRIEATFTDAGGATLTPLEARIQMAKPSRGIEPVSRPMQQDGSTARLEGSDMSLPGHWIIRIDALLTEFDKAMFETSIHLQ